MSHLAIAFSENMKEQESLETESHENDLPLSANIKDIEIYHCNLHLKCFIETKTICGIITLFCKPKLISNSVIENKILEDSTKILTLPLAPVCSTKSSELLQNSNAEVQTELKHKLLSDDVKDESYIIEKKAKIVSEDNTVLHHSCCGQATCMIEPQNDDLAEKCPKQLDHSTYTNRSKQFNMVLDCCDIEILSVKEISSEIFGHDCNENVDYSILLNNCHDKKWIDDKLSTSRCSIELQYTTEKNSVTIHKDDCSEFPQVIQISYQTKPEGMSLKWTKDQDEKPCVFTHGHWINNRSLFPSQDAPSAMATWQATVEVAEDDVVVMSGDKDPYIIDQDDGGRTFYFYSLMPMPSSTVSLAVGSWKQVTLCQKQTHPHAGIPCRLFVSDSLVSKATQELSVYIPLCLEAAYNILGPHPFQRLDILVVPPCFDSLGMASPSVMYIAQSLLASDMGMCVRLAHEVSHSWFGLAIGPEDWTEEWLTEGFATYLEDIIHLKVLKNLQDLEDYEINDTREIKDYLRYRTLSSEVQHTSEELQTLRPNKKVTDTVESFDSSYEVRNVEYVKHGMNPEKRFMQVHYLKGYFLLRYLEQCVGLSKFLLFLAGFVRKYHGKLITSRNVFNEYMERFPEAREKGISVEELYSDWLNEPGIPKRIKNFQINTENQRASTVFNKIKETKLLIKRRRRVKPEDVSFLQKMDVDQISLYLDLLIEERRVPKEFLRYIRTFYALDSCNADIQHRWCELVIKHRLHCHYEDVESFLYQHQAMGVYLYGELIITRDKTQRQLAERVFKKIKDEMEPDPYKTVSAMLYGD